MSHRLENIQAINAAVRQQSGKYYELRLESMDDMSLRELRRLLRDLADEKLSAMRCAQRQPWRRP